MSHTQADRMACSKICPYTLATACYLHIFQFMEPSLRYIRDKQILKLHNHGVVEIGRDLWMSAGSPPRSSRTAWSWMVLSMGNCPGLCAEDFWITSNKWVPKCIDFIVHTCRTLGFWRTQERITWFLLCSFNTICVCLCLEKILMNCKKM